VPPEEFDWSLGEEADLDAETTPVGERGAQVASTNRLDVQQQLSAAIEGDQGEQEADSGDADAQGRQRDERGRFASQQTDGEGADEAQTEQGETGDEQGLILGKFKSVDDLVQSYQEAERRLSTQGNEVGTLRQELAEMRGALSQIQSRSDEPQQAQITEDLVSQVDELAVNNPQGAATWALENQPLLYNRVMQIWATNDPLAASRFEGALMREQLKQEMEERITQQYGPVAQTVTEQTQASQFDSAWKTVATKYPDLATYGQHMMDAAASAPELAQSLQTGDVPSKERLIENLYWLAKGRQADTIAAAATDLGRQQQQQTAAEKRSAAVASGSSSQARGEKTNIESWKEQFLEAPTTSIADGLREFRR
jgi:hypothetical protein